MSIFFDFEVGPSGRRFRRAVNDDIPDIEFFLDRNHSNQLFGVVDIGHLIELSTLSICMINEYKEVVGFMSLCDYPNVLGVNPDDWEIWIRNMFQRFYLSRNTLFIHFMCCKDSVLEYFLEEACISVFRNDVYLLNIVLFANNECDPEHVTRYQIFKKKTMCRFTARRSDDSETRPHYLYVAMRHDYCPKLKIRRAVEEDNDDIVKILEKKCPRLKELYGSYYISEIIGHHLDSNRKIIVPEYQDHAVGVMCLNSDINYVNLQRIYELRPYYGLMKATNLEKEQLKRSNVLLSTFGDPIMMGKFSPFDRPSQYHDENSDSYQLRKETLPRDSIHVKKQGRVNFKRRASVKVPISPSIVVHPSDDYSGHSLTPSVMSFASIEQLILDDDPFDYEIVNIDKSLLSLSEAFSCELLLDNKSGQSSVMSFDCVSTGNRVEPQVCKRKGNRSPGSENERRDSETEKLYNGAPNAFMIELFGLRDDVHESNSFDLLEAAFEIMKDYDYCVIRVPSAENTFALLEHFTFVPVKQRTCSEYSLYIAHRASVLGKLRVREAEFMDIPLLARFLQNVEGSETIYTIETSILDRVSYLVYVFMSGLSIVGVGILEPPEQLNLIRAKYNIDPYHYHKYHLPGEGIKTGFAAVKVILTYPVFEAHYRFFAREMMRLSGSNSLIWMTAYRNKVVAHKANSIASAMVPLLPRKTQIDFTKIPELKKIAPMANTMLPFTTWFLDKKLTSVPIFDVSTRIVLVGASRTCMAFLNALLFSNASTYLRFTNITLISSHGFAYMRHSSAAVELMFPKHNNTSSKFLKSVPYTYYVNTIHGTVGDINKQEKFVTLTHGSKYFYDLLFLFVGKQYQHPEYLKPLLQQNNKCTADSPYVRMDIPNKYVEPDFVNYNTPDNVFIVNHIVEASNALKYVKNLLTEGYDFTLIVYGATIHAYCCLTALLEMNVPAQSIVFVDPFPPENPVRSRVSVFSNSNVDETVGKVINGLEVKVYRSYYFQSWNVVDKMVTHVEFLSQFRMIKLECSAFFYYGRRGVNTQVFLAVNKSGMAFDDGVLIDHQCRTKDPCIYAAGPATAYCRRYFGVNFKQKYYDTYEVGEKLGAQIRNQLDPVFTDASPLKRPSVRFSTTQNIPILIDPPSGSSTDTYEGSSSSISSQVKDYYDKPKVKKRLPNYEKPNVVYCQLPGGLQYLEVRPPGKKVPHHYVQSLHFRGVVMETFKNGYFKLHLTNELIVNGVTCLTFEKYNLEKFRYLYGKSSVILNHVHLRYTTKKLDNFYEFFRSPWAGFLYHDQTDELFAMVKELLPKDNEIRGETLADALRRVGDIFSDVTEPTKLRKKFDASPYIEAVTEYVIEWVSQNDVLLPMYLQPSGTAEFLHDMERVPRFRKKKKKISKMIRKVLR